MRGGLLFRVQPRPSEPTNQPSQLVQHQWCTHCAALVNAGRAGELEPGCSTGTAVSGAGGRKGPSLAAVTVKSQPLTTTLHQTRRPTLAPLALICIHCYLVYVLEDSVLSTYARLRQCTSSPMQNARCKSCSAQGVKTLTFSLIFSRRTQYLLLAVCGMLVHTKKTEPGPHPSARQRLICAIFRCSSKTVNAHYSRMT